MSHFAMTPTEKRQRSKGFLLSLLALYLGNAWLARHSPSWLISPSTTAPEWPVLIDLLLVAPLLYLLVFRRTGKQAWLGAAMLAGTGMMLAAWIVPAQSAHWTVGLQNVRNVAGTLVVVAEFVLVFGAIRLIWRLLRSGANPDRAIDEAFTRWFGDTPVARLFAFDARMWFYALFASRKHPPAFAGDEHFSCHRKDGNASNQQGFLVLIAIETPILHVLLMLFWSAQAAWIVSVLSLFGLVLLIGEYRATLLRPISLDDANLYIRHGLRGELVVPLRQIAAAEPSSEPVRRRAPGALRCCEAGNPNIRLRLDPPLSVANLFSDERRDVERIYLGVDEPRRLLASLVARIESGHR